MQAAANQGSSRQCGDNCLEIITLGRFWVRRGEEVLTERTKRSNKMWELFRFLLTQRDRQLPPETIARALWSEDEPVDTRAALHSLIHRLRRLFASTDEKHPFQLEFSQGVYAFSLPRRHWLDIDEFVRFSRHGFSLREHEPQAAMDAYNAAINLYQGVYLPAEAHKAWLIPARHYYRRIYIKDVLELTELLLQHGQYTEVEKVCEAAFRIDPLPEAQDIHLRFMKAVVQQGKVGDALAHYEFIASVLQQQTGAQPAVALRDFYRLNRGEETAFEPELSVVRDKLREREAQPGAFFCGRDFFRLLYRLEVRRSQRAERTILLGLFTITRQDYGMPGQAILHEATDLLKRFLAASLRSGDVFCRWNQAQFLVLLSDFDFASAAQFLRRLERGYVRISTELNVVLRGQVQSLLPWD